MVADVAPRDDSVKTGTAMPVQQPVMTQRILAAGCKAKVKHYMKTSPASDFDREIGFGPRTLSGTC
ncbi:hypothetical protein DY468_01715 [Rhodopseudomonas sp. BR0M22]|nr:hypothetical protein [Rhodopseudomonas sp. BR0M22]